MNNSLFGKTQGNLRNRVHVELVTDTRILRKRVGRPSFYRGNPITDCLTVVQCKESTHLRGLFSARVVETAHV